MKGFGKPLSLADYLQYPMSGRLPRAERDMACTAFPRKGPRFAVTLLTVLYRHSTGRP